jgi:lysophospholipase L1-like esterase
MPAPARTVPRRLWRRLCLAGAAAVSALVAAEGALRLVAWLGHDDQLARWRQQSAVGAALAPGQPVRLGQMVRPAADPAIVYELLPHLDVEFQRHRVVTGSRGCRGGDPPTPRPEAAFVIVGLGDSVMFGAGVAADATFLAVLQRRLAARLASRPVVVVNTGVPGYNTAMEVATLQARCLDLRPDVVVIDFVENDFDLPNFLLLPPDPLRLDRCCLYELAYRLLRQGRRPNGPLEPAPMADRFRFVSEPTRVPAPYRQMVGPDGYRRALAQLVALSRTHGFRVVVSCHTAIDPTARAICAGLGLPVVTAEARQRAWLHDHGDPALRDSALVVAPDDPHPSALGHALLAEELFTFLVEHDWLPAGR